MTCSECGERVEDGECWGQGRCAVCYESFSGVLNRLPRPVPFTFRLVERLQPLPYPDEPQSCQNP